MHQRSCFKTFSFTEAFEVFLDASVAMEFFCVVKSFVG